MHNNHVFGPDEDDLDDLDDLCSLTLVVLLSDFPRLPPDLCADTSATWTVESVCAPPRSRVRRAEGPMCKVPGRAATEHAVET